MLNELDVRNLIGRRPVIARSKQYADYYGLPERLPDHCKHPEADVLTMVDGQSECFHCGLNVTHLSHREQY